MNTILISIIALPIIEILLFIKIGENIGALNTIFLIILTAVVGVYFARIQGIRTFHVDARKLWERPGVQEICKLVEEGKISPLVRIKQNPVFSIQPVPNLSQGQDFLPAQVQTLKQ